MSAKPLYGVRSSVNVTLNSLVDGAIADSTEYDNTTDLALSKIIEVNITGSNAAEAGSVAVYAKEGLLTGTLDTPDNLRLIGSVFLNGTTSVRSSLRYDSPTPFFKISFKQRSSNSYSLGASNNTAFILSENIQDI